MKKEVILLLFLITLMPIASADNFLTGRSIIEDIGNFFGNSIDFFKGLFAKDEVGVRNTNIVVEPAFVCNENAVRCNTGTECSGSPCVMKCQNNAWVEYSYCQESCSSGQCVASGGGIAVSQVSQACTENAVRCNTGTECSGSPCVMKCQNNAWVEYSYCQESCSSGQCVESGSDLDSSEIGSGSGNIDPERVHLECINNACVEIGGEGRNQCSNDNDCIEQDIPTPTNLQYEITNRNTIILTWNNVLGGNDAIDGTGAITGYTISENNNFISKITEFIKSFFKKGPIGVLEKKYAIHKIKNMDGRNIVEKIAEINKNDCDSNLCSYEYATPEENDLYSIKSKIGDQLSLASNSIGPIRLNRVLRPTDPCENLGEKQIVLCTTNLQGICREGTKTKECKENEQAQKMWVDITQCIQNTQPSQEMCNDNIDNDCDGLVDNLDDNCQENNQIKCSDNLDNDKDQFVDNLDIDCKPYRNDNLKIKQIKKSVAEVYSNSNIIIEGYYEIIGRTSQEVSICTNLTLNNVDMNCQQKSPQQDFIRYTGCNIGNEGLNKVINFSTVEKCNFDPILMSNRTYINVTEFTTCENGQISTELLNELNIIEPDNNGEFEPGERISLEVKVKNSADEDQEIVVSASLLDEEYEEIETSDSAKQNILKLRDKTFILNFTIPGDLDEGNYPLYIKAYRYRDEEEVCKSSSISIKINQQDNPSNECNNNNDCRRGFICERDECRSLSCNLPLILSPKGHSCITQTTEQGQEGQQGDAGNEGERRQTEDSDNDGLPDYWEYNFFGDLSQSPNDDFDNDGISNINEYINNTNPKISENEKSSPIWTILIIIVILGIITLAIIFAVKKIKNKSGYNFSSRGYELDNTNKSKIQLFVQQAKSQGMKKDEIKKSLLNAGWKEEDINKFL